MSKRKSKKVVAVAKTKEVKFAQLLKEAFELEGKLSDCYRVFHNYSFGNQILAWMQGCNEPINTYMGWQALGRNVNGGARAIELCMPVTIKIEPEVGEMLPEGQPRTFTRFIYRRNWFGISQTSGKPYELPPAIPFDKDRVLKALVITEIPFNNTNGNTQGFSRDNTLAINPVAKYPLKTLWHELAHIVLGHTAQAISDDATLPSNLIEVEAESVAYILSNIFNYDEPKTYSRGYIQDWLSDDELPESSAKRIFKAVSDILKANEI